MLMVEYVFGQRYSKPFSVLISSANAEFYLDLYCILQIHLQGHTHHTVI